MYLTFIYYKFVTYIYYMLTNIAISLNRKEGFLLMNFKKVLTAISTVLFFTILSGEAAFAAPHSGRIDGATDSSVYGWAWDGDEPDTAVEVQILVKRTSDGSVAAEKTVTADVYREDLAQSQKGNGCHSWTAGIDFSCLESGEYKIEAYSDGSALTNPLYYEDGVFSKTPFHTAGSEDLSGRTLVSLGTFKTTAYCPCYGCSEGWGRRTSTGALASASHTIAVDPRVIPYGSQVLINGVIYTAEDKGGGVKGNHIDIYFNTHGETQAYGVQYAEAYLVM